VAAVKESLQALASGEVHVWLVEPERWGDAASVAACDAVLSAEERTQCLRFRFPEDQQTYRASHALVRSCLSRYAARPPQTWTFTVNEHGRPDLPADPTLPPLRFNLSHTRGLAAVAVVLGQAVGVDVEFVPRRSATTEIADRFFAPAEVDALHALPAERQRDRFFDYWTLKESYIKGRGRGLSLPLGKFAFSVKDGAAPTVTVEPSIGDDAATWQFALWSPTAVHRVAVAVQRGGGPDVRVGAHWSNPLASSVEPPL
jgi:4'-phosphopantetheinyl transferase